MDRGRLLKLVFDLQYMHGLHFNADRRGIASGVRNINWEKDYEELLVHICMDRPSNIIQPFIR